MFYSTGYPDQFDSAEEVQDNFLLLLKSKYVNMASE